MEMRKLIVSALSMKKIGYLEQQTLAISNNLIDGFIHNKKADLLKEYAFKLPAMVICDLLAIPKEDFDYVFKHIHMPNVLLDPVYHSRDTIKRSNASVIELQSYFSNLCEIREGGMGDDLISLLLQLAKDEKSSVTRKEVISNIFFLFGSGYETTMNLICNVIFTLFSHPLALRQIQSNWDLLPQSIDEVIRFQSPVQVASPSKLISDLKIDNYLIPKGETIIPILAAANRDPDKYPNPDVFDINRKPKKLLAFGYGPHLCLGSHLARLEVRIAVKNLLQRIPGLNVNDINQPRWKPHIGLRALESLTAIWE